MDSQGGFSRGILKGDSPGGFSRGILKNPSFGDQKVMSLGIPKRRGTQLRAGWSDSQPVSSVLRSIYAKSVDLQNDPYWLQPVILQQACALDSGGQKYHLAGNYFINRLPQIIF